MPSVIKKPHTPANVDGTHPQLDPTAKLSERQILWPHVSMEMFKTIAGNKLDVSKLHLLILPGYRQGFDSSPDDDETKPIERLARMLKISKDDSENKHFRLAKANKNFPSMEYFLAAFSEMATRRV